MQRHQELNRLPRNTSDAYQQPKPRDVGSSRRTNPSPSTDANPPSKTGGSSSTTASPRCPESDYRDFAYDGSSDLSQLSPIRPPPSRPQPPCSLPQREERCPATMRKIAYQGCGKPRHHGHTLEYAPSRAPRCEKCRWDPMPCADVVRVEGNCKMCIRERR